MINREVFYKDPTQAALPNDGVSEVTEPQSAEQWKVLAYELETFVCDGAYQAGLERILSTFLRNLGEAKQPAAWVSGFFGSGKSHLVRVMEFLWRDTQLPNGATARSLTNLPPDISDLHLSGTTERHNDLHFMRAQKEAVRRNPPVGEDAQPGNEVKGTLDL